MHIPDRIDILEDLCDEYIAVLFSQPRLWSTLPQPFENHVTDTAWMELLAQSREGLQRTLAERADSILFLDPQDPEFLKVSKRVNMYMNIWRQNSHAILLDPASLATVPNPCDPSVSKRAWEGALHAVRKRWRGEADGSRGRRWGEIQKENFIV